MTSIYMYVKCIVLVCVPAGGEQTVATWWHELSRSARSPGRKHSSEEPGTLTYSNIHHTSAVYVIKSVQCMCASVCQIMIISVLDLATSSILAI